MDSEPSQSITGGRTIGVVITPLTVRVAQALGLTASAFLAGASFATTDHATPSLLAAPADLLLRQWKLVHVRSRTVAVPGNLLCGVVFAWLASREPSLRTHAFRYYAASAALLVAYMPYTYAIMRSVDTELLSRSSKELASKSTNISAQTEGFGLNDDNEGNKSIEVDSQVEHKRTTLAQFVDTYVAPVRPPPNDQELSIHQLVNKWAWLNLGRAAVTLAGATCAVWGVVCQDLSVFELFQMAV